uniref:Uncharacterized protein n=1 Tax=Picea sitchensis TaxID=3332 RepID=A9NXQ6_PICSI|nr:unknown [Picea sitchensis]
MSLYVRDCSVRCGSSGPAVWTIEGMLLTCKAKQAEAMLQWQGCFIHSKRQR